MEKQEFEVELIVTRTHLITTFSRSAEEAISDAENLLDDGEYGEILSTDIEAAEAFPIGDEPREAEESDEDEGVLNDE